MGSEKSSKSERDDLLVRHITGTISNRVILDKYGRRKVVGRGPFPCSIMGVGEAPGKEENTTGKPFIGKTGKEMERLMKQAGIDPHRIYLTNVVKYRPLTNHATGNKAPTAADIERDEPELVAEIARVKPKFIIAIGRVAARWFFEQDIDLEDHFGFAYPDLPRAQGAVVIVVMHPAAGFHSPEQQPPIYWSFMRAGMFINGELEPKPPVDEFPDPDYYHVRTPLRCPIVKTNIAVDTEGVYGRAWCLTYSMLQGSAGLVLRKNKPAIGYAKDLLLSNKIGLHNAAHDLRILAELFNMPLLDLLYKLDFEDTMQMAYVLRLLPKGLKALGRRFKGVEMQSYMSVAAPADREIMLDFFKRVLRYRCGDCDGLGEQIMQPVGKAGKLLAERPVKCETCGGDGTGWEPPPERLEVTVRKVTGKLAGEEKVSIASGRRMGWRVRNIVKDADKIDPETGRPVDLRKRWEGMKKDNYEFVVQVEDRLGEPRPVTLDDVPFDTALTYSCRDADVTKRIWPDLEAEVKREQLWPVYEMDRNVIPMITRMMDVGWKIDVPYLDQLSNRLQIQQDKILYRLEELVGHSINPNSSKQVAEVLFDEMELHPVRLTDSGQDSTDNKVLADLRIHCNERADSSKKHKRAYNVISGLLEYRERGKLRSTYTLALPRLVDKNSRLHTALSNTSTESGRLTSKNPNLQNISTRSDNGKLVRGAFICDEGNVLLECDYQQAEFRLMAHEAGEKSLIRAIRDGVDPHNLTCSKIFGIPLDKVTKSMWQRDASKTLNFAILYGASAATIKMQIKLQSVQHTKGGLDIPIEQCQEWIDSYTRKTYPAIGDYMADSQAEARRYGYVSDMWGRRRYLPGVHSPIGSVKNEAERIAVNHKIQAGVAGIVKHAMSDVWVEVLPKFRRTGFCEALLQIHDSLVIEVRQERAEELKEVVTKVMGSVVKLKVPFGADGKVGLRWNELKAA